MRTILYLSIEFFANIFYFTNQLFYFMKYFMRIHVDLEFGDKCRSLAL